MAWTNTPYTNLETVKALLKKTSTSDDALLSLLIPMAQSAIDSWVGHTFQSDAGTSRTYMGNDHGKLYIDLCQSISAVSETYESYAVGYDGVVVTNKITTDITNDTELLPYNISPAYMVTRKSGIEFGEGNKYVITGTWGYASVPTDVQLAATLAVVHYRRMSDVNFANEMQEGLQRLKYTLTLPDHVKELLARYRRQVYLGGA